MNFFNNLPIALRITLFSAFLAAVFLGVATAYIMVSARAQLIDSSLEILNREIIAEVQLFESIFQNLEGEVLILAQTPAVQGMIRAREQDNFDSAVGLSYDSWKSNLEETFRAAAESQGLYAQLRFIDVEGNELVRVDYNDGVARVIPEDQLQNKKDRPYFREAIIGDPRTVYSSRIELNREGVLTEVSTPYTPVARYSVPIFNAQTGEIAGLVVANVLFKEVLHKGNLVTSGEAIEFFVVDSEGYFLQHPDKEKEWGGPVDLNTGVSVFTEFPEIADSFSADSTQQFELKDKIIVKSSAVFEDELGTKEQFLIIASVRIDSFFATLNRVVMLWVGVALLSFVILFFMYRAYINYILKPLVELRDIAAKIGAGDFSSRAPVRAKDEIGSLAHSINTMASSLGASYARIQQEVQEKTKELTEKVSALKKVERSMHTLLEDLSNEKEKLELATSSADIGVWEWNLKTDELKWDGRMYELYGVPHGDFSGAYNAWSNGLHPEDRERSEQEIQEAIKEKKRFDTTFRIVWPNGTVRYIKAGGIPRYDADGKPDSMVGVNWDITHEKVVDRAKTEFVSLASHQLRTPLSAINWYLELLEDEGGGVLNKKQKTYLEEIRNGSRRMVSLVNALLDVSRLELGTFREQITDIYLTAVIESVGKEMKALAAEHDVTLVFDVAEEVPVYRGDEKSVRMIFENLLSNAIKYSHAKGTVSVSLAHDQDKNEFVYIVKDAGIGIPEKQQDKIFSKLFRADNARRGETDGTGLGLYLVHALVKKLDGSISFVSAEDKGTTFTVTLPAVRNPEPSELE